jgi:hypothetical protein
LAGNTSAVLRRLFGVRPPLKLLLSRQYDPEAHLILKRLDRQRFEPTVAQFATVKPAEYDVILPLDVADFAWLRRHDPGGAGIRYFLPSAKAVELCDDKLAFAEFLEANGFAGIAPVRVGDEVFPRIVRRRRGQGGVGVHVVREPGDLQRLGIPSGSREYFSQEYIPGDVEYTTHFVFAGGAVRFHRSFEFRFDTPFHVKGEGTRPVEHRPIESAPFAEVQCAILQALGFEGVCCFNYKIVDGRLRIFELNPRFGTSLRPFINEFLDAWLPLLRQ